MIDSRYSSETVRYSSGLYLKFQNWRQLGASVMSTPSMVIGLDGGPLAVASLYRFA